MALGVIIKTLYQEKWFIFWLTVLGAVLAFDLMVLQPPQYKASSKLLVIQKELVGQNISQSARYFSGLFKEIIYSDSFLEKEWQKSIKVKVIRNLGIIEIDVFQSEKEKAEQINLAVTSLLKNNHQFYHGAGQNIELRILNKPLVGQKPDTARLWSASAAGGLIGFLIGFGWILRRFVV